MRFFLLFLIDNSLGFFLAIWSVGRLWIILFLFTKLFPTFFPWKLTYLLCFFHLKSHPVRIFIFLIIKTLLKSILLDMAEQLVLYPHAIDSRQTFITTRVHFANWRYWIILSFQIIYNFLCRWIFFVLIYWFSFISGFLIQNQLLVFIGKFYLWTRLNIFYLYLMH